MQKIEVGGYFYGEPKTLAQGVRLNFSDAGLELQICLENMTEAEARAIKENRAKFALFEEEGILFFLVEIPDAVDWSDAPFNLGIYTEKRNIPEIGEEEGLALTIFGLEASNAKVKATRYVGLGTEFSKKLIDIFKKQQLKKADKIKHFVKINQIYQKYTANMMADKALIKYEAGNK